MIGIITNIFTATIEAPTPLDFWEYAKTQGPGWVVAFFSIIAVIAVVKEYGRREKFWKDREEQLIKALETKDTALDSEKDARREEALNLQRGVSDTMSALHETISQIKTAMEKVNETMMDCHRRGRGV